MTALPAAPSGDGTFSVGENGLFLFARIRQRPGRPALDQPFADIVQPPAHLRAVRDLAVTAKGNNQSDHSPHCL
mgnify:FL=1